MDRFNKRIFYLGSCVSQDLANHFSSLFNEFGYEVEPIKHRQMITPALSTLLDPIGPLTERLLDEKHKEFKERLVVPEGLGKIRAFAVWRQYQAIVRLNNINSIFGNIGPHDILILDFHGDLYTKFDDGKDVFMIYPDWHIIQNEFPRWFAQKVNTFPNYQADMVSLHQVKRRKQKIISVIEMVRNKFHDNVIVVDNAYTTKVYLEELGLAGEQIALESLNIDLPFITVDLTGAENLINLAYIRRIYDNFYAGVKAVAPGWKFIGLDHNKCYADLNHRHGQHPTHLHSSSWEQARQQIKTALVEIENQTIPVDHPIILLPL